jgi:hypothetical protein
VVDSGLLLLGEQSLETGDRAAVKTLELKKVQKFALELSTFCTFEPDES